MFLRQRGRRVELVHSVRAGKQVRHRRLYQFTGLGELANCWQQERWDGWVAQIRAQCPELGCDSERLRRQAAALLDQWDGIERAKPPCELESRSAMRVRQACRVLLDFLERPGCVTAEVKDELEDLRAKLGGSEPPPRLEVMETRVEQGGEEVESDLRRLARQQRRGLPRRCVRVDSSHAGAAAYLRSLDLLAGLLARQGRLGESGAILHERVRCCPEPGAVAAKASVLLKLGRVDEAVEEFSRLPGRMAERHYNLAAAHWVRGSTGEALDSLLAGFVRERAVAEDLRRPGLFPRTDYWARFGDLWTDQGRKFFLKVYQQLVVRWSQRGLEEKPRLVRRLVPHSARGVLLDRVLAQGAAAEPGSHTAVVHQGWSG